MDVFCGYLFSLRWTKNSAYVANRTKRIVTKSVTVCIWDLSVVVVYLFYSEFFLLHYQILKIVIVGQKSGEDPLPLLPLATPRGLKLLPIQEV